MPPKAWSLGRTLFWTVLSSSTQPTRCSSLGTQSRKPTQKHTSYYQFSRQLWRCLWGLSTASIMPDQSGAMDVQNSTALPRLDVSSGETSLSTNLLWLWRMKCEESKHLVKCHAGGLQEEVWYRPPKLSVYFSVKMKILMQKMLISKSNVCLFILCSSTFKLNSL